MHELKIWKIKNFSWLFLILNSQILFGYSYRDFTRNGLPNVRSSQAIVMVQQTGEVLLEKDADTVRPIASLSKVVSAMTLQDYCKLDPNEMHEMSTSNREAARGGDKSKLTTGWLFSNRDLLYAALLRSDNRALPALVESCGLTPEQFALRMNEKVQKLGLTKTQFIEPTGLSIQNVSTAREYAKILMDLLNYPELTAIMQTERARIRAYKNGRVQEFEIRSTDRLLAREHMDIIAGKTGYTDPARYCFGGLARITQAVNVAMVFLNSEGKHTRFGDFSRVHKWLLKKLELPETTQAH